jgi:hypothetical protein
MKINILTKLIIKIIKDLKFKNLISKKIILKIINLLLTQNLKLNNKIIILKIKLINKFLILGSNM